jgi:HD-like signal output (HDOD) protein
MLDPKVERKLDTITSLPVVPYNLSKLLTALENTELRAKYLAELIESDQALTLKVLQSANSPYYGTRSTISTVELAIVIMGLNSIKEIVIGMIVKKIFKSIPSYMFNLKNFWDYSVFCGSTSRLLARKMGYQKTGEAFVAGLTHDMGILIILQYFAHEYNSIEHYVGSGKFTFTEAEDYEIGANHSEIGAWLAERWRLPIPLINALRYHHTSQNDIDDDKFDDGSKKLTKIVATAEWFAEIMGYKGWSNESKYHQLFCDGNQFIDTEIKDVLMTQSGNINLLKQEILKEYERAIEFNPSPVA